MVALVKKKKLIKKLALLEAKYRETYAQFCRFNRLYLESLEKPPRVVEVDKYTSTLCYKCREETN